MSVSKPMFYGKHGVGKLLIGSKMETAVVRSEKVNEIKI